MLLVLLLGAPSAFSQAVYGSIFGTVTDPTGAAVPNATITVLDVAKGTSITTQSNGAGEFTAEHLIPDIYSVKVTAQGFKSYEQTGLQIFADTSTKVTAALALGAETQTVEVNADQVPLLKVDRADVSTEFGSQEIIDLPIPGRNFTNLQLLLPGAQSAGFSHAASENPQGSKQIMVDGQAFAGVAYQLDGTDNQDPILGIIVINPNADSLSESKIATQNFDAEFGKAVASVVTAQTRSGSNSFHGSAFDYRASNYNLARDPFTQGPSQLSATNPFPAGLKNQFGGSVGGPILKNRLFFFGDYQGVRQKVGLANVQTVPSAHLLQTCLGLAPTVTGVPGCDFSEYLNALPIDAKTGIPTGTIYQNVNGVSTPYPGNVIPAAQLSAPALALFRLLQPYAPNTAGSISGLKNNYAASGTGGFNSNQWDVRGDYTLSDKIHLFGRFSRFTDTLTGTTMFGPAGGAGFGLGGYAGTSIGANDSAAAGADIAINSKLVTDVRLGYFRYNINTSKYDQGTAFATQLGIPNLNTGAPITSGAPAFELQEVGDAFNVIPAQALGPQYGSGLNVNRCNCPLIEKEDQFQLANNWTKTIGNHAVKFGGDLRYARNLRVPSDNNRTGILEFNSGPTSQAGTNVGGLGFATLVLGETTNFLRYVSISTNAKEFQKRDFFYIQDTWRTTPKLTLNLGLRYELYFPETVNAPGNGSLLNLDTGYLQVAGIGTVASNMNYTKPHNAYNPRVGFAYQATPKTVIRAGYGRSFDIGVFGSIFGHTATQSLPVLVTQQITQTGGNQSYAFLLSTGPTTPVPTPVPANGLLPNPGNLVGTRTRPNPLRLPTLDAWNLSLQQSLTPTLSLTIAYVGNKGTHTLGDSSGNAVNPNEAAIVLPAQYSVNGLALHYDPNGPSTITPTSTATSTSNATFLQRYYGGKLPACSDPGYAAAGGVNAANGGCGWTNALTDYGDQLDTHYNALQVTLTKQMAHGYSLNANYAWQQAMSEAVNYSTWSHSAVYGRDTFLRQQQIIVYGLFELPFGRNKPFLSHANGFVNQAVSGIQISPVVNFSSGLPFTLNYSSCSNNVPGGAPCYVNGLPGAFHPHVTGFPGNKLSFYNPYTLTANSYPFQLPTLDQIGNVGRNTAFGPHFFNTDISIQKNFLIRERVTFQLRADGFNAFNHINWGTPNQNVDQGGAISSGAYPDGTSNPRQLQFSARVQF
ncbi:MAG TPA: TonB-dependent receptor [Granulicella sp.]|nr:TonB-dependent receptor [Granulicella sp.]